MGGDPWEAGGGAWAAEQQRRRSMLSFTLIIMTITLFLDGGSEASMHRARMRGARGGTEGVLGKIKLRGGRHTTPTAHELAPAPQETIDELKKALGEDVEAHLSGRRLAYPSNISGVYTGDWVDLQRGNATEIYSAFNATATQAVGGGADGARVRIDASPAAGSSNVKGSMFLQKEENAMSGTAVLRLASLPTRVEGVHAVTGLLEFHTRSPRMQAMGFASMHPSSHAAPVSGIYLARTGRLSVFANAKPESISLQWGNRLSNVTTVVKTDSIISERRGASRAAQAAPPTRSHSPPRTKFWQTGCL